MPRSAHGNPTQTAHNTRKKRRDPGVFGTVAQEFERTTAPTTKGPVYVPPQVAEKVSAIQEETGALLPPRVVLSVAQRQLEMREIKRLARIAARNTDFPMNWAYDVSRSGHKVPTISYTDEQGNEMTLAQARRNFQPHERQAFQTTFANFLQANPRVNGDRLADAFRALRHVRGEDVGFRQTFGAAMSLVGGKKKVNLKAFSDNLEQVVKVQQGARGIAIAHEATKRGLTLRSPGDVIKLLSSSSEPEVAEEVQRQLDERKRREDYVKSMGVELDSPQAQEYIVQGSQIAGDPVSLIARDFIDNLGNNEKDYIQAGKEVTQHLEDLNEDSFWNSPVGHFIGKAADYLGRTTGPITRVTGEQAARWQMNNDAYWGRWTGRYAETDPVVLQRLGRPLDPQEIISDTLDIVHGRDNAYNQLREFGLSSWETGIIDMAIGFSIAPDALLGRAVKNARLSKLVSSVGNNPIAKAERVRAVMEFIETPIRRLGFSNYAKNLKNMPYYRALTQAALDADDPVKMFAKTAGQVDTYFGGGLHGGVQSMIWHHVQDVRGVKSVAEIEQDVRGILMSAFGVHAPPGSLAERVQQAYRLMEQRDLAALQAARAGDDAVEQASQSALGALDDVAGMGPVQAEIPHATHGLRRAIRATSGSRLGNSGFGRAVRAAVTTSPEKRLSELHFTIEGGTDTARDFRSALARSRVYSTDEMAAAELELNRVLSKSNPTREADFTAYLEDTQTEMVRRLAAQQGMSDDQIEFVVSEIQRRFGHGGTQDVFGAWPRSDPALAAVEARLGRAPVSTSARGKVEPQIISEPFMSSQLRNDFFLLDPVAVRTGMAEAMGTVRQFRNFAARSLGKAVPDAKFALGASKSLTLRRIEGEIFRTVIGGFYAFWKPLAVMRPAYVLRVVGLEEQGRFLATAGLGERLRAGRLTSRALATSGQGETLVLPLRSGATDEAINLARGLGYDDPADAVAALTQEFDNIALELADDSLDATVRIALDARAQSILAKVDQLSAKLPDSADEAVMRFNLPGRDVVDDPWSNNTANQWEQYAGVFSGKMRHHSKWAHSTIDDGDDFFINWEHDLGNQVGQSPEGRIALTSVRAGDDKAQTAQKVADFLRGDGKAYAQRVLGDASQSEKHLESMAETIAYISHTLTGSDPSLARAALDGTLSKDMLKQFGGQKPLFTWGPQIESQTSRGGLFTKARDAVGNAILREPTNRLSRQPYFRSWYDRTKQGMVEMAREQGVELTEAALKQIDDAAANFARMQVKRVMFDFTRNSRFGEMAEWVFPFFQPYGEAFVVWGRILRNNPALAAYARTVSQNAEKSGFVKTDPDTGVKFIPFSNWALTSTLLNNVYQEPGWALSMPLSAFNTFMASSIRVPIPGMGDVPVPAPGLNPEITWLLGKVDESLGENLNPSARARLQSWVFEYGEATAPDLLPPYLQRLAYAVTGELFSNETGADSASSEFLKLLQQRGVTAETIAAAENISVEEAGEKLTNHATSMARSYMGYRSLIGIIFPGAPIVEFPTEPHNEEFRQLVDKYGGDYLPAREEWNERHPDLWLFPIGKTTAGDEAESPVSVPATDAVRRILNGEGAAEFAKQYPEWVWAIIPSEVRENQDGFNYGIWQSMIADNIRRYRTPEEMHEAGQVGKGWEAYYTFREQRDAQLARLQRGTSALSESDPAIIAVNEEFDERIRKLQANNPWWGDDYGVFEKQGLDPKVLDTARALAGDELFAQTDAGKWLGQYLPLLDKTRRQLAEIGVHSLDTNAARDHGIAQRYKEKVAELNKAHPDGAVAYEAFFRDALSAIPQTKGEKRIASIPKDYWDSAYLPWKRQYERADNRLEQVDDPIAEAKLYQRQRDLVARAYEDFPKDRNPSELYFENLDDYGKRLNRLSVATLPYIWADRFTREYHFGQRTNKTTEAIWSAINAQRIDIDERRRDPSFSSSGAYEALDNWVRQKAQKNKLFREQLAAANDPTYGFRKMLPHLFPGRTSEAWDYVLGAGKEINKRMLQGEISGSEDYDDGKVRYWNSLRTAFTRYVKVVRKRDEQFDREWRELEDLNGSDTLVDTFVPSIYFPLGGFSFARGLRG